MHKVGLSLDFESSRSLGSRICCDCRGKGQHTCRKMFAGGPRTGQRRMPRSMAPEIASLPKSGRMPRTTVYVSQLHARNRPDHRAWAEATENLIIALPEEKPVDTNETGDMHVGHVHGDPDCPVRFGTHDGRVAHSAHLRKLHSASRHLRLGGRDLTEYIMKWLSLHPQRGRLLWISQRNSASCDTVLTTAVIDKENLLCTTFTHGALPVTCSAPSAVSCAAPPPVAPAVTYMGEEWLNPHQQSHMESHQQSHMELQL